MSGAGVTSAVTVDVITASPIRRLAATLDITPPAGDTPLPPMWHWLFCLPDDPTSVLDGDGHTAHGRMSANVAGHRRMFAGGTTEFHGDLLVGDEIECTESEGPTVEKNGRSGPLAFRTVIRRIRTDRGLAVVERQNLVYTDAPAADPDTGKSRTSNSSTARAVDDWTVHLRPDERLLFRFSALTFNTHRIHYDAPYVTHTEGYPGLVVHGPLIALLLANLAAARLDAPATGFSFRAVSPVFAGQELILSGSPTDSGATLTATTGARTAMTATLST